MLNALLSLIKKTGQFWGKLIKSEVRNRPYSISALGGDTSLHQRIM